jgi:DNA-binding beta-propeller fold protein YncE
VFIDEITGLSNPRGIAVDGSDVYVAHGGQVDVFTDTGAPVDTIPEPQQPYGLRIASLDGQRVLLVADRGSNSVRIFDLDGTPLQQISGGLTQPQGVDVRGQTVAVANFGRNRVSLWAT